MNRKEGIKHLNNTGLTSLLIVVLQLGLWFYMPVHRLTAHSNTHCCDSEGKCDTSNREPCAICDFNFWFYVVSQKTDLPQTEYRLINTTYNQIVEIVYPEYTFHYYRRGPPSDSDKTQIITIHQTKKTKNQRNEKNIADNTFSHHYRNFYFMQ